MGYLSFCFWLGYSDKPQIWYNHFRIWLSDAHRELRIRRIERKK